MVQDRFAEGRLQTLIEPGPKLMANPENHDNRANSESLGVPARISAYGVGAEVINTLVEQRESARHDRPASIRT